MVIKIGTAGNDVLAGTAAADSLSGLAGNDQLTGGAGADKMDGGTGVDVARYDASALGVTLGAHTATGGDAAGDTLTAIENLIGSGHNDALTGDGGANTLLGLAGTDTLDGGAGTDVLAGGLGADKLIGGAGIDTADYSASSTFVSIDMLFNNNAGGDASGDSFSGIENVTGSKFNDQIIGDGGANVMRGGEGNDHVLGLAGDDHIVGGLGADLLEGDKGADSFVYTSTAESAPGARDVIDDFSQASHDKIDLSAIDANLATAGNDKFQFEGFEGPLKGAAQVSYEFDGNDTFVAVKTNPSSSAGADMVIQLHGHVDLTAADFVL